MRTEGVQQVNIKEDSQKSNILTPKRTVKRRRYFQRRTERRMKGEYFNRTALINNIT
jgi:hypothetical protein